MHIRVEVLDIDYKGTSLRHWSRYGVNGALEMTFMNYELWTSERGFVTLHINMDDEVSNLRQFGLCDKYMFDVSQ